MASVVGLIVVGAVFMMGVVVGKKYAVETPATAAVDLFPSAERGQPAPEAPLTFQKELMRPGEVARAEKPVELDPTPKPIPAQTETITLPSEPAPAAKHEDKQVAKVAEVLPAKESTKAAAKETAKAEKKPAKAAESAESTNPTAGAVATRIREVASAPNGGYALQVSAFRERSDAERLKKKLQNDGLSVRIVSGEVSGKGTYYRVRVGKYASREEALRGRASLKGKVAGTPIVVGI